MEKDLADLNSIIFGVYLSEYMSTSVENAYPFMTMFDNAYLTGTLLPVNLAFTPFTFMVDLETMQVLDKDRMIIAPFATPIRPNRILKLAQKANEN
ncbi:MAG: hypothetical protein GY847_23395 [Proteobacteria bacterium]|nr:hypothetical protein [Pseudomonadota bacterium]